MFAVVHVIHTHDKLDALNTMIININIIFCNAFTLKHCNNIKDHCWEDKKIVNSQNSVFHVLFIFKSDQKCRTRKCTAQ